MSLMLIFVNWFTNPDVFNLNTTDVSFWYVSLLLVWCFVEKENKSLKSVWFYCFSIKVAHIDQKLIFHTVLLTHISMA